MRLKETCVVFVAVCLLVSSCEESKVQECGAEQFSVESRIFGGEPLEESNIEFPWLVALHHRSARSFFCAGSLISAKHVLSAAHCFQEVGRAEKLEAYEVLCMLGRFNLSDSNEEGSVNSMVLEIVIHDEWNSTNWRFHADIAILVLMDLITFSDTIQPVCLPQLSYNEITGVGTVVGWGKSEQSGFKHFGNTPSKVEIPAVNGTHCLTTFPKLAIHASDSSFCGGYDNQGKAPCLGDSGGGFYLKSSSAWHVSGVVSGSLVNQEFGCDINKFQLYTNVARFNPWIARIMKKTKEISWDYVDFSCIGSPFSNSYTFCHSHTYKGPWTQNLKIRPMLTNVATEAQSTLHLVLNEIMMNGVGISFPKLTSLKINGNPTVQSIERRHFEDMSNLKSLSLGVVKRIAEDALENLVNLEELSVIYTDDLMSEKPFSKLGNLKELTISGVPVNFAPGKVFRNLKGLKTFNFFKSSTKKLERSALVNLQNLKELSFDESAIEEVMEDAFKDCKSLEKLSFEGCNITNLSEKTFWNLNKLKKLSLARTAFKSIPSQAFRGLSDLEELNWSASKVESIDQNTFRFLVNLKVLNLGRCKLQTLPAGLFENNLNLEVLTLNENSISPLNENIFKSLVSLREFYFNGCELETLPKKLFHNCLKLEKIDLKNNYLKLIGVDFTRLTKLQNLDLRGNKCIDNFFEESRVSKGVLTVQEIQDKIRTSCNDL